MSRAVYRRMSMIALMVGVCAMSWGGPNVLLLWDDDEGTVVPGGLNANTKSLVAAMEAAGFLIKYSYQTQGKYNGANPAPEGFDAVVHLNGGGQYSYILSNIGASRLVDYVKNRHGAYVGSENNAAQLAIPLAFGGLPQAMWEVTPIDRTRGWGTVDITVSIIPGQELHPLLRSVPASFTFSSGYKQGTVHEFSSAPAVAIMKDTNGNDAVAVRELGTGRIIGFHHTGNTLGQGTLSNPYVQRLYINAVLWGDTKSPSVASIMRADANPSASETVNFKVQFSEGVTGVTPDDFTIAAGSGLQYQPTVAVSSVNDREYTVTVNGISGNGTLGVNLNDNDSIRDKSFNQNRLGEEGPGNGNFTGEIYTVDRTPPVLSSLQSTQLVVPEGERAHFTLTFSEAMATSVCPRVDINTVSNGAIHAGAVAEGGDGLWKNNLTYEVSSDRAIVARDEGTAGIVVSGAQDLMGVAMRPNTAHSITLVRGGLRLVTDLPGFSYGRVGKEFSFQVRVEGAAGTPEYEWYKRDIHGAGTHVGPNAALYTLKPLKLEDSGTYYCVVSDALSSVQTRFATLQVVKELPAAHLAMAMVLAALCAGAGVLALRRRY